MTAISLPLAQLRRFAPDSPVLAFRPEDTGNPMQDWCNHLGKNSRYRRELEELAVLGDVVVRIADGCEKPAIERVKILSLEYAMKVLENETDAKEFVRSVRAIAAPEADQFELEQIAAFYYGEIRRAARPTNEVLKEMALLGMQLEAVTATVNEREVEFVESDAEPQKLTAQDEKRIRAAQANLPALPAPTPNFDAEQKTIQKRLSHSRITRNQRDEFAEYLLDDTGKTLEELDADFAHFDSLEQYDENGIVGFAMSGNQHSVVVYEFDSEVDASYLPEAVQPLAREMRSAFMGNRAGGRAAACARRAVFAKEVFDREVRAAKNGVFVAETAIPEVERFSTAPLTENEFNDWLAAKLETIYDRRTRRTARRITTDKTGNLVEFWTTLEVNPDYEEIQYAASVMQILWTQLKKDFHARSLRVNEVYQNLYLDVRQSRDTAEVAQLKKAAFALFKTDGKLSLKEFTAFNAAAQAQESRLADRISATTRKLLAEIKSASPTRVSYFKYFLYNDANVRQLARQEKQLLWAAVKERAASLKTVLPQSKSNYERQMVKPQTGKQFVSKSANQQQQTVRVTARG